MSSMSCSLCWSLVITEQYSSRLLENLDSLPIDLSQLFNIIECANYVFYFFVWWYACIAAASQCSSSQMQDSSWFGWHFGHWDGLNHGYTLSVDLLGRSIAGGNAGCDVPYAGDSCNAILEDTYTSLEWGKKSHNKPWAIV
jgi:hypothetical protein